MISALEVGRRARIFAFGAVTLLAPVAWSPQQGLTVNDACAESGTCCVQSGAICFVGEQRVDGAYWNGDNRCPKPPDEDPENPNG